MVMINVNQFDHEATKLLNKLDDWKITFWHEKMAMISEALKEAHTLGYNEALEIWREMGSECIRGMSP